jgi:hypothetical protein
MKKYFGYFLGLAVALTLALPTITVFAADVDKYFEGGGGTGEDFATTAGLGTGDLATTIGSIVKTAMGFLGIVAVVIILYGGFVWMTAHGDEKRVTTAKNTLGAGIIGLIIVLAAYAITVFVMNQVNTAITPA